MSSPPLEGLRVIDFTRVIAGPYLTQLLADLGAEVIKIEDPRSGDDFRHYKPVGWQGDAPFFLGLNRNKQSVAIDLGSEAGRQACRDLIATADILVENFRPGVMARHGLAYDDLKDAHPKLIYCSLSGYGHATPYREVAGYDPIAQAEAGMMFLTGEPDREWQKAGGSVADSNLSLHAGMALLAAVNARHRDGRGQFVDVSLFDSMLAALGYIGQLALLTGKNQPRYGNQSVVVTPMGTFECADGAIMLVVGNDRQYDKFCREGIARPDLAEDARFRTLQDRLANREALEAELADVFRTAPREAWVERLRAAGVPAGAVRNTTEALASDEARARGMIQTARYDGKDVDVVWTPMRLSETPPRKPGRVPQLGEDTEAVLRDVLGYDDAQIAAVRDASRK